MTPRAPLLLLALLPLAACASAPKAPQQSPIELRLLQSRSYSDCDPRMVLKAVLGTLQDEGFAVRTADSDLGFITATRETLREADPALKAARWTAAAFTYGLALLIPSPKDQIRQLDGTAQVEELGGGEVRLRVSFQLRVVENGRVREVRDVTDPLVYQAFLAKVDKSLFLQREKL